MNILAVLVVGIVAASGAKADDIFLSPIVRGESFEPYIVGGAPADPGLWPGTLIMSSPRRCTATVVGPRAIITASHCVTSTSVVVQINRGNFLIDCTKHPKHPANPTADVAICRSSVDLPVNGGLYETINFDSKIIGLGDDATILGYGCLVEGGSVSDILYVGSTIVTKQPLSDKWDFELQGGAKLCAGDSGGAAYRFRGARSRVLIGVQYAQKDGTRLSYAASTSASEIAGFLKSWSNTNQTTICGYNQSTGCR